MKLSNSGNEEKLMAYLGDEKFELKIITEEKEYILISILNNEIKLYKKINGQLNINSLSLLKTHAVAVFKGRFYENNLVGNDTVDTICELKLMELPLTKELYLAVYQFDMKGKKVPFHAIKSTVDGDNINEFCDISGTDSVDEKKLFQEISAFYDEPYNIKNDFFIYNFVAFEFLKQTVDFKKREFFVTDKYRLNRDPDSIYKVPRSFDFTKINFIAQLELSGKDNEEEENEEKKQEVSFDNVYCLDDIVEQFRELGVIMTNYQDYDKKGVRLPYGILLIGEPGTGKTLMINAFINEYKLTRYDLTYERKGREQNVGTMLGDLLMRARRAEKPAVVVIDEIDKMKIDYSFFQELNGQVDNRGIMVIATANSVRDIHPALLRPGRFDRKIIFPNLNKETKIKMLEESINKREINHNLDLETIIGLMTNPSPAAIDTYVNEAKLQMVLTSQDKLTDEIIMKAIDRVDNGFNVPTKYNEESREKIRIHEAGHAIVALEIYGPDSIAKIDTTAKAGYGGVVKLLDNDKKIRSREDLYNTMKIGLGGIVAEKLFDKDTSVGAYNDLDRVRDICESYIADYGLNDISAITARMFKFECESSKTEVIEESKLLINQIEKEVTDILLANRDKHLLLVKLLKEKEVLYRKDIVNFNNSYITMN